MSYANKIIIALKVLTLAVLVSGCGGKGTNEPSIKLTASSVDSLADTTAHTHVVSIPFTDVSASPVADIFQYRSDTINGHSHVIALSRQQMTDINNGMRVILASSTSNSGTSHTHSWSVKGGDLLYEKNCYNCHSNDKRGHSPMNVSFNSSQTAAEINPSGAPLSTSPSANPDPNYSPSTVLLLDGMSLYTANCATCHGTLATSTKLNKTFAQIKNAISTNTGGMSSLGALSDAQLQAIATVLIH